jgi:hypothetical protein
MPESAEDDLHPYIHGIKGVRNIAYWNMSLSGTLTSADFMNLAPGFREVGTTLVREVPIEELRDNPRAATGAVLPRLLGVIQAAMIRSGMTVGMGAPPYPFHPFPPDLCDRIVRIADMELLLERIRRETAPGAPSRLSCIWLADNTTEARTWISQMFGAQTLIVPIRVEAALATVRLDARWLPASPLDVDEDLAAGYWSGQARTDDPAWETLVEGIVCCDDEEGRALLRAYVQRYPPATWSSP